MTKVLFNIKKLQFSPIDSIDEIGTPTYGTPIKLPGTVSLSLDPEGESEPFYADGIVYYLAGSASSYTGSLENALFTKEVLTAIYNYVIDKSKNVVETTKQAKEFGLQFAVDSDTGDEVYFTLYRVSSTKPNIDFATNEGSATINPQSVDLTVASISTADGKYQIMKSYAEKDAANYADYFTAITIPEISEVSETVAKVGGAK